MTLRAFLSNKRVFCFLAILPLFLLLVYSQTPATDTKGIGVVIKDKSGKDVGLYKGSYALLVGASHYKEGWPNPSSEPSEIMTVKDALEKAGFTVETVREPDARKLRDTLQSFIDRYGYEPENWGRPPGSGGGLKQYQRLAHALGFRCASLPGGFAPRYV